MVVVVNYVSGSSFFYHALHLEGEEVFGFTKRPVHCPLAVDNDYHHLECVNFFHPRVTILATYKRI